MANAIYEFFKNHIKMSMYGTRCEIWSHVELDPLAAEVKDSDKAVVEELGKLDAIIEEIINAIDTVPAPENAEVFNMKAFDGYRAQIEKTVFDGRAKIDQILAKDTLRNRLFEIALKRQQEMQRQQQIQANKQAINPANIAGSPADLGGKDTCIIEKKEDGSAEVKPVPETK